MGISGAVAPYPGLHAMPHVCARTCAKTVIHQRAARVRVVDQHKKSATGTRTRVGWVRAKYPYQLEHSGHGRSAPCVRFFVFQRHKTSEARVRSLRTCPFAHAPQGLFPATPAPRPKTTQTPCLPLRSSCRMHRPLFDTVLRRQSNKMRKHGPTSCVFCVV